MGTALLWARDGVQQGFCRRCLHNRPSEVERAHEPDTADREAPAVTGQQIGRESFDGGMKRIARHRVGLMMLFRSRWSGMLERATGWDQYLSRIRRQPGAGDALTPARRWRESLPRGKSGKARDHIGSESVWVNTAWSMKDTPSSASNRRPVVFLYCRVSSTSSPTSWISSQ